MNESIKNAIMKGKCIILLGAGASVTSKNRYGNTPPIGNQLAIELASEAGISIDDEDSLPDIYEAALSEIGTQRIAEFLSRHFSGCAPSNDYLSLVKFPFPRIYTFNIDDAMENAAIKQENYNFKVMRRNDRIEDFDQLFLNTNLIKLNGDIKTPKEGFIFSPTEYGQGSATEPLWYGELARDFHRYTFLFIGTKLKEPLFNHQVQKYKEKTKEMNSKSYLIVPQLSIAQIKSFESTNIEHIKGTLSDFIEWLENTFPNGLSAEDVIKECRQDINFISKGDHKKIPIFSDVIAVSRSSITLIEEPKLTEVKNFYKGYKPTWDDILKHIPASLKNTRLMMSKIRKNKKNTRLFVILGSAGTGKTTAIKQLALELSEMSSNNVYFINGTYGKIKELVNELNLRNNEKYYIFIDRLADLAADVDEILNSDSAGKVIFVGAENTRIWKSRVSEHLVDHTAEIVTYETINIEDVDPILDKIEKYGSWTRLSRMTVKERRIELFRKAEKQLLIGLLEATSGEGFNDIIKKDYENITSDEEKMLLLFSGLATLHRSEASVSIVSRAFDYLGVNKNIHSMLHSMVGIVVQNNEYISARHRIYFDRLISSFVKKDMLKDVVTAYIHAYSSYNFPIVLNISKKDSSVYKGLVNFKFLKKIFNGNELDIREIYESFEKLLEQEGLFLLQYGLALRNFGDHSGALEKLRVARDAFPTSPHIEHAYSQQLLILACQESEKGNEEQALDLLYRAKEALEILSNRNKYNDKYPLITLSINHIKILHTLNKIDEAKQFAKYYFNQIDSRFKKINVEDNDSVSKTKQFLMNYFVTGKLALNDEHISFDDFED
ncbi:SIR2 family protein [Providencia rettgeri]|uniref:P-loop NTPase n=1 Tax=Providencia rettgeri TaxID=587 RepID=UPI00235F3FB6|nr:SIR2 family protein [Providencia rettgeri]